MARNSDIYPKIPHFRVNIPSYSGQNGQKSQIPVLNQYQNERFVLGPESVKYGHFGHKMAIFEHKMAIF